MRRYARVRICLRSRENEYCSIRPLFAGQRAIPEAQVALPRLEVAGRLSDNGESLFYLALQRGHRQSTSRPSYEATDRDHTSATLERSEKTLVLRRFKHRLHRFL